MLIGTATSWTQKLYSAYDYSLIVGLYFMACIAFERYLLVSHPIWSKSHHSLKLSCFISVIIWLVPLIIAKVNPPCIICKDINWCIVCLIPYPIIILCFAGTWRGLSRSISLTALQINFGQFVPGAVDLHISHSVFFDYVNNLTFFPQLQFC